MLETLQNIADWFTTGIYDFFVEIMAYITIYVTFATTKILIFLVGFFWDVGQEMFAILEIQTLINNAITQLDSKFVSFIAYVRGFDALLIVLNAKITRYMLNIIGF